MLSVSAVIERKTTMKKDKLAEEKIFDAACRAEEISDIAFCAIIASRSINPADREKRISGVLYGIVSLCRALSDELNSINEQTELM